MDKVKVFLAVLKKQHFWVLCVLILLLSTGVWMSAVGEIERQTQAHLSQIQSSKQDAENVQKISQHPNEVIIAAYNAQTKILKEQVYQVWDTLYKKQQKSVLKWPPALGDDFIQHMEAMSFGGRIPVDFRDRYRNYIRTRWTEIPPIIKAKAIEEDPQDAKKASPKVKAGAKTEAPSIKKAAPDWIVIWKDQDQIRRQLFSADQPTEMWVWVTQEDLWVYENLLNIIKKTNSGASGPHNAIVSTISNMDVGMRAASGAGGTERRISSGSTEEAAAEESGAGGGAGGSESSDSMLAGRYVDEVGVPITDAAVASSNEYKRIPVRLNLRMDPREIPLLILNCANAELPVEIQQVRMNANSPSKDGRIDLSPEDRTANRKSPHVEVSLQGVIYLFNPPNREKLKLPPLGESGAVAGSGDGTGDGSVSAADALGTAVATPPGETASGATDPAATGTPEAAPMANPLEETPPAAAATGAPAAGAAPAPTPAATPPAASPAAEAPEEKPKSADSFFE